MQVERPLTMNSSNLLKDEPALVEQSCIEPSITAAAAQHQQQSAAPLKQEPSCSPTTTHNQQLPSVAADVAADDEHYKARSGEVKLEQATSSTSSTGGP